MSFSCFLNFFLRMLFLPHIFSSLCSWIKVMTDICMGTTEYRKNFFIFFSITKMVFADGVLWTEDAKWFSNGLTFVSPHVANVAGPWTTLSAFTTTTTAVLLKLGSFRKEESELVLFFFFFQWQFFFIIIDMFQCVRALTMEPLPGHTKQKDSCQWAEKSGASLSY